MTFECKTKTQNMTHIPWVIMICLLYFSRTDLTFQNQMWLEKDLIMIFPVHFIFTGGSNPLQITSTLRSVQNLIYFGKIIMVSVQSSLETWRSYRSRSRNLFENSQISKRRINAESIFTISNLPSTPAPLSTYDGRRSCQL